MVLRPRAAPCPRRAGRGDCRRAILRHLSQRPHAGGAGEPMAPDGPLTAAEASTSASLPPGITLEGLGDWKRTHTCGELNRGDSSRPATLMGWVHRVRD